MKFFGLKNLSIFLSSLFVIFITPSLGWSADYHLNGAELSIVWAVPFICMLVSIAVLPLAIPDLWGKHFGKISFGWGLAFLIPCALVFGVNFALYQAWHAMIAEFIPFIILIFTLFVVAGGVRLTGSLVGTPVVNITILVVGTILASWMGTTGAAMLLIRPLLRANAHRKHRKHSVIFFIFLVANMGGCLTPLGDPPLFLGFLKGVTFFWTFGKMIMPLLFISTVLLVIYFALETYYYKKEGSPAGPDSGAVEKLGLEGKVNLILLLGVVIAVFLSGTLDFGSIVIYHVDIAVISLVRDLTLLFIVVLSMKLTSKACREANDFSWEPIIEVGKIFLGIFISMVPAIAILQAGSDGALASVVNAVFENGQPNNAKFFWLTGGLSSFLDNAPTYVVFFNTAGGNAQELMTTMAPTLTAISAGAVFMGANTYIGNAPNFMVRSIAENQGVDMPSFLGYMLWSGCILLPIFVVMTFIFF